MLYLSQNLKRFRVQKNLTQEELAAYLYVTPQSVSKWERGETLPDVALLPALANIFETSVDLLLGMDAIRAEQAKYDIHDRANRLMRTGGCGQAEKVYRDALRCYPSDAEMMLGLASVLALTGGTDEAIALTEKGLPLSDSQKQSATMRAVLCLLYQKRGDSEKALALASCLPHMRESREAICPVLQNNPTAAETDAYLRLLINGTNSV